ncbi:hypothetical protein DB313_04525 [Borrelia turcica IST7]|uniref:Uncharacterized protein n=1 Tax=Borrelia turcica IST7 TaxID=1104446 RepID=A0A386PNA3_9SPIR|nr:hypothetical protein DB313_04525 [Borrelia turcica IST7]
MRFGKGVLFNSLLLIPNFLFANVVVKEQIGINSNFSYLFSDYEKSNSLGTGIFGFENEVYLGFSMSHSFFQLEVSPSFVIKRENKYLDFKNAFLNLYFDTLIVKLGKQNYHIGSGLIENIILGRIKKAEEWFTEVYYSVSYYAISFGAMLDQLVLSELESSKYVSPWGYFQISFPSWDLLFMLETPFHFKSNNVDIKLIFDASFEIYNGIFFYSTIRQDLLCEKDYAFRSQDNRYLLGLRYYTDFENTVVNGFNVAFESYSKSNNYFISTAFVLSWIENLFQTSAALKFNLSDNSLQVYLEGDFSITKILTLKIKSIFEPLRQKILFKSIPLSQILSIEIKFKV